MRSLIPVLILALAAVVPARAQAPAPTLAPATLRQGGMACVSYSIPEGRAVAKASLVVAGATLPCAQIGGQLVCLFAASVKTKPGGYTATLWVRYDAGLTDRFPLAYTVKPEAFVTQRIHMAPSKTGLMSDDVVAKERAAIYEAMEGTADRPLWEGRFQMPIDGRISSPFGRKRYVNGVFWGQHGGRDLASPAGKPVHASNSGRILLARKLWIGGNVVMVDHGLGVFTFYEHLSRIDVRVGQEVKKGDVLGLVGSTGFSTGPHLHFEMRVHRTPTNPAGPLRDGIVLPTGCLPGP